MNKQPNQLINEKSPYLLQHAYNPVNWYPWSEEAFDRAKKEDKPIFLSIGYSTCHWCHVMERESFEDEEVAEILNEHFISVKVDREERPDVDSIYMEITQALTGSGGWPLTLVMTPEQVPFFAATYVPKHGNGQHFGLIEVLTALETRWKVSRKDLLHAADKVKEYTIYRGQNQAISELDPDVLEKTYNQLEQSFDPNYGGFGKAPKFPSPHYLMFLLRYSIMKKESNALDMLNKTLTSMVKGGMYDQIGFGFSRYSVDEKLLIPHFEKMLYDNALLTLAYIESYLHTKNDLYQKIAKETLAFVQAEMMHEDGGFYTALDADSEGIEGKFYVWSLDELNAILTPDEVDFIVQHYNVSELGNFEGTNVLNLLHIDDDQVLLRDTEEVKRIKNILLEARNNRTRPHLDDKILTSVNAMMIIAFTHAYTAFNDEKYLEIAEQSLDFIFNHLVNEDHRLLARYRDGEAKYLAYSEDYVYLIWALIDLFIATGKLNYISKAVHYHNTCMDLFYDEENGGLYQTAKDSENLLFRNKEIYDGAIPSSNSVFTMNCIRLAEITDEPEFEDLAVRQFQTFGHQVEESPTAHMYMLSSYLMYRVPKRKIVLVTEEITHETLELQRIVRSKCVPCTAMVTLLRKEIENNELFSYYLEDEHPQALHICENYACNDPIYDFEEMKEELDHLILSTLNK